MQGGGIAPWGMIDKDGLSIEYPGHDAAAEGLGLDNDIAGAVAGSAYLAGLDELGLVFPCAGGAGLAG